jgi:ectoine hydroxylase-related dioxygenase (phytanoyl-CoA dioxygenase family)
MDGSGFVLHERVFSDAECEGLAEALSASRIRRSKAGARHLMSNPLVAALAKDRRLVEIARGWIGQDPIPYRATLFEKTGEHNWLVTWHQDTTLPLESRHDSCEWGPWSSKENILYAHAPTWALSRVVALRLHLDSSTARNGPLRVIPESHVRGVMSDEEVFEFSKSHPGVECHAGRGAVLAMTPLLVHASSKAELPQPRRVLHFEYAEARDLSPGIRLALA